MPCFYEGEGGSLCYPTTAYPTLQLQARLVLFVPPRRFIALSLIATTAVSAETSNLERPLGHPASSVILHGTVSPYERYVEPELRLTVP
jgi:hypothetical protein